MTITLDGTSGITSPNETITGSLNTPNTFGFKNRIINGGMVIDQRNAGASVSINGTSSYVTDRFKITSSGGGIISASRSTTAPTGFVNSLSSTVSTADSSIASSDLYVIDQIIEGFNTADLGFGTASASTVTLSFWVRSSVTGTYGVRICNGSFNRTYVSTYAINSANTWEQKSITIAGDTTGTWTTDNSSGIAVSWDLGSGTNWNGTGNAWQAGNVLRTSGCVNWIANAGATFYITGVQLEKGSTATSFDQRAYGTELALCQRYYESTFSIGSAPVQNGGATNAFRISQTAAAGAPCRGFTWIYKTTKRDTPSTITSYNPSAANANVRNFTRSNDATISGVTGLGGMGVVFTFTGSTGSAVGDDNGISFSADAEL